MNLDYPLGLDEPFDEDLEEIYLPHLAQALRQSATVQNEDLIAWAREYFPDYFFRAPSELHRVLASEIRLLATRKSYKVVIIAPRETAKSTWLTFLLPLYCICEGLKQYIIIISDVAEQAEKHLDGIKHELTENERIEQNYPHVFGRGSRWKVRDIITRNGIRVETLGTEGKIRGRRWKEHRPDLIIPDDPENDQHAFSALRRERRRKWLHKAVEKAGAEACIALIGTMLHRDCLVANTAKIPGWKSYLFKSIMHWPTHMELWWKWKDILCRPDDPKAMEKARSFYWKQRKKMNQGARVLWPEFEDLYALMLQWAADRVSFESEKQNNPVDPEACEWPEDYFDYEGFWFDEFPESYRVRVIGVDPSKGKDAKRGDYSSICRLQCGNDGYWYADFDMKRRPVEEVCEDIIAWQINWNANAIAIETNQFQELMAKQLIRTARKRGIPLPVAQLENMLKKEMRIRRIGPWLCGRQIRFRRSPGAQLAVEQMRDFAQGDHDDGPDSLEMAQRIALRMVNLPQAVPLPESKGYPGEEEDW